MERKPPFLEEVRELRGGWRDPEFRRGFISAFWSAFWKKFIMSFLLTLNLALSALTLPVSLLSAFGPLRTLATKD